MPPRPPLSPPPPPRRNMPAVGDWSDGAEATRGGLCAPKSGVGAPGWGVGFAVCDGSGAGGVLGAGPGSSDLGRAGGALATSFDASGAFGAARGAGAGAGGAAAARGAGGTGGAGGVGAAAREGGAGAFGPTGREGSPRGALSLGRLGAISTRSGSPRLLIMRC